MIRLANPDDPLYPAIRIYRLCSAEQSMPEPEVQYNYSDAMNLIIVSGNADAPGDVAQALSIAAAEPMAIYVAVMSAADLDRSDAVIRRLRTKFGAVFLIDATKQEDTIERLVKMIITPGSAGHPWCFDWSDMHYIVTQGDRTRPVRLGSARASGPTAATVAAQVALKAMNIDAEPIQNNLVLYLVSLPKNGSGRQFTEAKRVIDQHLGSPVHCGPGIYFDDDLPADTVEVDIYSFGQNSSGDPASASI